ncbi:MAG: cytochrome c3 family protein [Acidobacteriota bacterium]
MKRKFLIFLFLLCIPMAVLADKETCGECHEEIFKSSATAMHARTGNVTCSTCHAAAEAHLESGSVEGMMPDDLQRICFSCHTSLECDDEHCSRDEYTCDTCHSIHEGKGKGILKACCTNKLCGSCHKDVKAQMNLPNHHPVPEGKMTCFSCHSPHAGFKPSLATGKDVNDLCWNCHTSKQGPYIFEHEPVVEDCRICHSTHGSVADNLLNQNEPFLCLQCHEFHFHAGLEGEEEEELTIGGILYGNRHTTSGYKMAFTTSCTQCHIQIHGSDLPAQTVPGRGEGLTR